VTHKYRIQILNIFVKHKLKYSEGYFELEMLKSYDTSLIFNDLTKFILTSFNI